MNVRALSRPTIRVIAWSLLGALLFLDAGVASSVSLGLLYFFPLVVGATYLPRSEALLLAGACAAGRGLFGPSGDPLGLAEVSYHLPWRLEPIVNGALAIFAYFSVALLLAKLSEQRRRLSLLREAVETDPLTGVGNRRALARFLEEQGQRGVSVLALDLDRFKQVNDEHGHDVGDRVLQELGLRLVQAVRGGDLVARTGGEEFAVVLPGADAETTRAVGERILRDVRGEPFRPLGLELRITLSIGAATGSAAEELLPRADRALYRAKKEGRDRMVSDDDALQPVQAAQARVAEGS